MAEQNTRQFRALGLDIRPCGHCIEHRTRALLQFIARRQHSMFHLRGSDEPGVTAFAAGHNLQQCVVWTKELPHLSEAHYRRLRERRETRAGAADALFQLLRLRQQGIHFGERRPTFGELGASA